MLRLKLLLVVTLSFFSTVSSDRTDSSFSTRIVNGEPATIDQYPYLVSFISNNRICSGFIVSKDYIVTAAHCVRDFDPPAVVLRAGSSFWNNGTIIHIAEAIPHPDYDFSSFDKDVAVLKTVDPIQFTDDIQVITLAEKNRPIVEKSTVMVSGWGTTVQGASTIPDQLMQVEMPVLSLATCWVAYASFWTENMWCGGDFEFGGPGTCNGDSGGAAVQDDLAVGIVSFGRGCGKPFAPSIFTNIAAPAVRDFIKEQTGL